MRVRINYSIVFVSNMERSVAFYRDIVGIPVKFQTPQWTEFITDGATLALHKSEGPAIKTEAANTEHAGHCRAGFQVPNLSEFHARMTKNQIPCLQVPTETFNVKIAQYADPDGLVFSVIGAESSEYQKDTGKER